jgi:DNA-directed RNA polymerase subunit beta'
LTEEEYLDCLDKLPKENQHLDDTDPNKFIAKMGAESLYELLRRLDLDDLSYDLRDKANNETSQQRKKRGPQEIAGSRVFQGCEHTR